MMPTETQADPVEPQASTPQSQPKVFGEEYVKELRAEAKRNRLDKEALEGQIAALQAKVAQTAPADDVAQLRTLLETERKQREEAAKDAAEARRESLRLKVATDMGLPAALASRLNGESEEELRKDAESLKPLVGTPNTTSRPTMTTTAVPGGAPQGETDEQKRARIMRNGGSGGIFG